MNNMVIYKYELPGMAYVTYDIPLVKILDVKEQNGISVVWAIIDLDKEPKKYTFTSVWTGWAFKEEYGEYIGTTEIAGLVRHYFMKEI